jgi:hypothetical protein
MRICTYPPLKAPTGFFTGNGAATSASLGDDEAKARDALKAMEGEERVRKAGAKERGDIVSSRVEAYIMPL